MATGFTRLDGRQLAAALARRFVPTADRVRDLLTRFGLRPYVVRVVRTRWSGGTRGVGAEQVASELRIEPTPRVGDLAGLTEIVQPVGLDEVGGVLLSEVSGRYTEDELLGRDAAGGAPDADEQVFYEIEFPRPDGRSGERRRFFVRSAPHYDAGRLQWMVRLEKQDANRTRAGDLVY